MQDNPDFTAEELTGRSCGHLRELGHSGGRLHREAVTPYLALRAAAAADGIDLVAFSGFRDFDRQLAIWNGKFRGERPLLGRAGEPVDALTLSPADRVAAILWWSALPGASRHHWGSDFDVMDAAAVAPDYRLQVVTAEYAPGGPFARLTAWLDVHMHAYGFYRPYCSDRGGVRPEPWHLSYAPVAERALRGLTTARLRAVIEAADIDGKPEILGSLERVHATYVANVDAAPQAALAAPRLA